MFLTAPHHEGRVRVCSPRLERRLMQAPVSLRSGQGHTASHDPAVPSEHSALPRACTFALRRALAFPLCRAFGFGVGHVVGVEARRPGTKGKLLWLAGQQWVGSEMNDDPGRGAVAGDRGRTPTAWRPAVGG